MSGIRFVSTGELEGITARQGNHLCDYPQGMPICTQNAGGLTFFRRTVFRKRRTEALFEAQYLHFIFGPNQNTPCSQGVFWFGHCTNWGIGKPARPMRRAAGGAVDCTNWGIGKPARPSQRRVNRAQYCTNWGIGKPARLHFPWIRIHGNCTNWGIGKPARLLCALKVVHPDCTNWGIGKPARLPTGSSTARSIVPTGELESRQDSRGDLPRPSQLYQLGNWKAGKTQQYGL